MIDYDENNVFAKVISGRLPTKIVYENEYMIAINDINPVAKVHVLAVPKGKYVCYHDFMSNASIEEISGFFKGITNVIDLFHIKNTGYRLITNSGKDAHQEVHHFHMHILGGNDLGRKI